jgi:hypothetical protein
MNNIIHVFSGTPWRCDNRQIVCLLRNLEPTNGTSTVHVQLWQNSDSRTNLTWWGSCRIFQIEVQNIHIGKTLPHGQACCLILTEVVMIWVCQTSGGREHSYWIWQLTLKLLRCSDRIEHTCGQTSKFCNVALLSFSLLRTWLWRTKDQQPHA